MQKQIKLCYYIFTTSPKVSTLGHKASQEAFVLLARTIAIKKQRTYIYVDGFNLYYGVLKNTPYRWLDLKSLFQKLLNDSHDIQAIKYYTAKISVRDGHEQAPIKQQSYIRALKTYIPEFSAHYGHYLTHPVTLPLANNINSKKRKFAEVLKSEEKGSDVNLAVHLLNDAWLNKYDCAVIVSNDSDLAESMKLVKAQHKKTIGLITPSNNHNRKPTKMLRQYADFMKCIRTGVLSDSLLPDIIPGTKIHKPKNW